MQRLQKHTNAKNTQAYICNDNTSIHMQRLQEHTYAKITQAYMLGLHKHTYERITQANTCKDYRSRHM